MKVYAERSTAFLQVLCFDYLEQSCCYFLLPPNPFSISIINRLSTIGLGLYEMYFLGLKSFRAGFAIHNVKATQMCPCDLWRT